MAKLLVLDFETTGPEPLNCMPIEIGMKLYDTETRERSRETSLLLLDEDYPEISEEITELTGITQAMLDADGFKIVQAMPHIEACVNAADMLVAYNVNFDRTILHRIYASFGKRYPDQEWFCAMNDVPWPERMMRCRKLQHRALDLGLSMDGREAHRAMADVDLVCDILDLFDMQEVLAYHAIPWVTIAAASEKPWIDGGKSRDVVKGLGFGWEAAPGTDEPRFDKKWVKRVKHYDPSEYPVRTWVVA